MTAESLNLEQFCINDKPPFFECFTLTPCLAPCEVLDKNPHNFLASGGDTFLTIPRPVKYQGLWSVRQNNSCANQELTILITYHPSKPNVQRDWVRLGVVQTPNPNLSLTPNLPRGHTAPDLRALHSSWTRLALFMNSPCILHQPDSCGSVLWVMESMGDEACFYELFIF